MVAKEMPSLFDPPFPQLIQALPVRAHSVSVDADFWMPKFEAAGKGDLFSTIFGADAAIRLSRERLLSFDFPSVEQKCAEILLWGYPTDKRGVASGLLPLLSEIVPLAEANSPWQAYYNNLDYLVGIGISTITKFAYFFNRTYDHYNFATDETDKFGALILDSRLIKNTANWPEVALRGITYTNAHERYIDYLCKMYGTSARIGCSAGQLELFLFCLGDSF
jgi:hypothetical protein